MLDCTRLRPMMMARSRYPLRDRMGFYAARAFGLPKAFLCLLATDQALPLEVPFIQKKQPNARSAAAPTVSINRGIATTA